MSREHPIENLMKSTMENIRDMVDDKTIPFNTGVEMSYLTAKQQVELLNTIEAEDNTIPTKCLLVIKTVSVLFVNRGRLQQSDFIVKVQRAHAHSCQLCKFSYFQLHLIASLDYEYTL